MPSKPKFSAVIFDMDGVIVDSEHQWRLAEGHFFDNLVGTLKADHHKQIVGLGVEDLYHWLVCEYGIKESKENFLAKCEELAFEIYRHRVTQAEGFSEFITDLKKNRIAIGLASSSPRSWIELVMTRFNLSQEFQAVVSADDAGGKTKPLPDIYLLAAQKLGAKPKNCIAIEDSRLGVTAAKKAGMFCVAFRNGANDEQDLSHADIELQGFRGLSYHSLISKLS